MLNSFFRALVPVALPYAGRQAYMLDFDLERPTFPDAFSDYVKPVTDLVRAAGVMAGKAFLTVDEKIVAAGMSQRRPGPHVDGQFLPEKMDWSHGGSGWNHYCNAVPMDRMPVIVASSVVGCKAWEGRFDAQPKNDGDLSHLDLPEGSLLEANMGFLLSPDCIHESMVFDRPTRRTFMRIALPVGSV